MALYTKSLRNKTRNSKKKKKVFGKLRMQNGKPRK